MAGRRLLDAAKLFNATRSIAKHHIDLRAQQLELFTETSTLARVVKNQTDRFTNTAKAAVFLARRFREPDQGFVSTNPWLKSESESSSSNAAIPRTETVNKDGAEARVKEGLEQDHHYGRSESNTSLDPLPDESLHVQQERAKRHPLPDGTIPQDEAQLNGQSKGDDTFSDRPTPEPAKKPLAQQQLGEQFESDGSIHPTSSDASTIPLPEQSSNDPTDRSRIAQRNAESQIPAVAADAQPTVGNQPEEDVFHYRSPTTSPDYSNLPRAKIPKLSGSQQGNQQALHDAHINPDTFTAPKASSLHENSPDQYAGVKSDQAPDGVNLDVFRTARVSQMLGGNHGEKGSTVSERSSVKPIQFSRSNLSSTPEKSDISPNISANLEKEIAEKSTPSDIDVIKNEDSRREGPYQLRESRVPSSRLGRLLQYGGLATGMAFGAVGESFRRITGVSDSLNASSLLLSPRNMERLVAKLSRMRGAALKLGQMVSFQDLKMLPPPIHEVLQRVQDSADYMPASQRDAILQKNLGSDWRDLFISFEDIPIAAASIGQVHKATLRSTGKLVAVKVQFPGVATSIDSDLNNLSLLLTASKLLPKGLFLDKTIANARTELGWECDYIREAAAQRRFYDLLKDDSEVFVVPEVVNEASGPQVLTAELMTGTAITKVPSLNQTQRDWLGTHILRLCLREITEFRFMQTDPNWTNFLFNAENNKIELLDFGASREYPDSFIDPYVRILIAASRGDRTGVYDLSLQLGYLTSHESRTMAEAHIDSVVTLAEPFSTTSEVYDFRDQTITDRVRSLIPIMLRERLAPPPEETYSLHRKLSGAFLLCARLGSRIRCREMFQAATEKYLERATNT